MVSVSNGYGPSLRVRVQVETEPELAWWSRTSQTRLVDSSMVQLTSLCESDWGGFSAGSTAVPSENSYNMLAFAI
jgi:hypothetical protein